MLCDMIEMIVFEAICIEAGQKDRGTYLVTDLDKQKF